VNLLLFFQIYPCWKTLTIKIVVTFSLSHVNLMINKDILVKNT